MIAVSHLSARVATFALRDVTFAVDQGQFGVVIGPAGAGKTTLLETLSGLVPATAGSIVVAGQDVTHLPPEARRIGIVYQHAYLFPHMTVARNIGYGATDEATVKDVAARFGVTALAERQVTTLSGGERQLVALARALARHPRVLLLDEPFAALDNRSRTMARRALRALHQERGFTALQVTHDFAEAGLLGDVLMLLDGGRMIQSGTPESVFHRPATPFVADFVGAENVLPGRLELTPVCHPERSEGSTELSQPAEEAQAPKSPPLVASLPRGMRSTWNENGVFITGPLTLSVVGDFVPNPTHAVIRAEEMALSRGAAPSSMRNQFEGMVADVAASGAIAHVTVDVLGIPLVAALTTRSVEEMHVAPGVRVLIAFKATAVHLC